MATASIVERPFSCASARRRRGSLAEPDTDTTAVLTRYPAIYVWGCLLQSAPFLRDDSRLQSWGQLYSNAVNGANAEHERSRSAGSRLVARYKRLG